MLCSNVITRSLTAEKAWSCTCSQQPLQVRSEETAACSQTCILETSFGGNHAGNLFCRGQHDLAQQHVLQAQHSLGIIKRIELLKGLKEIGVRSLVVLFLCMQGA